jgi:hypothetical protein
LATVGKAATRIDEEVVNGTARPLGSLRRSTPATGAASAEGQIILAASVTIV